MSGATFSAPTGATQGLQGYVLDRGPKELYPATMAGLIRRLSSTIAARRKAKTKRGALQKDHTMPPFATAIDPMLTTLQASVLGILAQAAPDQREDLLKQSLKEFGEELTKALDAGLDDELTKRFDTTGVVVLEEDPLMKGLGCVGRIAQLVQNLAEQARNIIEGRNLYSFVSTNDGRDAPKPDDPASEEVAELLQGMVKLGEMALRAAVNEHVVVADDDEEAGEGERLLLVPSADAPDDERLAIVVKTTLPDDLAKFATDPAALDAWRIDAGALLMAQGGIAGESLEKFLVGGGLAKAAGDVEFREGGGEGEGGDAGDEPDDPLDVIGRLGAAIVIQVSALKEALDGGGDEAFDEGADLDAEGAGGGEGGGGNRQPPQEGEEGPAGGEGGKGGGEGGGDGGGDQEDPEKKAGMGKGVGLGAGAAGNRKPTYEELEAAVANMTPMLAKLAEQPAPPKGNLIAVRKDADGAGDDRRTATPEEAAAALEELRKRDPDAALHQTLRDQLRVPIGSV